jgi:DnaJ-class molecular chaperone
MFAEPKRNNMSQSNNYNGNYMEMFSDDEPNTEDCPTCNGRGYIDTWGEDSEMDEQPIRETCLTCHGEGWIEIEND